jgi:hypothetical protein
MSNVARLLKLLQQAPPNVASPAETGGDVTVFALDLPPIDLTQMAHMAAVAPLDLAPVVARALEPFEARVNALAQGLEDAKEVCEAIAGVGEIVGELLADGLDAVGELTLGEIKDSFQEAFDALDNVVGEVVEEITDAADTVVDAVDEFITPAEEVAGVYSDFKPMFQAMSALQ